MSRNRVAASLCGESEENAGIMYIKMQCNSAIAPSLQYSYQDYLVRWVLILLSICKGR